MLLRTLVLSVCLSAAFAAGFALAPITAPSRDAARKVGDTPQVERYSIHRKRPPAVSVHVRQEALPQPERQAEVPILPEIEAPQAVAGPRTELVRFASAPFPYDGLLPNTDKPFLNVEEEGRRARKTPSGRLYWEDTTYSDNRVLLHVPAGFDIERPGVMVLFFHGHGATLERDVAARQKVPEQISESGINAVLVAPQFAVDARDSSAGKFWQAEGVRRFLDEAASKLAEVTGRPQARTTFARMPVVVIGYSGGYLPTAWVLHSRVLDDRLRGVVLLDGLYGEVEKFASWIERDRSAFFLSAYTGSTRRGHAALKRALARLDIAYDTDLEPRLRPDSVSLVAAEEEHRHYVTRAWAEYPIADLLNRMTGTVPRAPIAVSAALQPRLTR